MERNQHTHSEIAKFQELANPENVDLKRELPEFSSAQINNHV